MLNPTPSIGKSSKIHLTPACEVGASLSRKCGGLVTSPIIVVFELNRSLNQFNRLAVSSPSCVKSPG
jgi:hypothetical protein